MRCATRERYAIGIFISNKGVDDFRVLARKREDMSKARKVVEIILPYLANIEDAIDQLESDKSLLN